MGDLAVGVGGAKVDLNSLLSHCEVIGGYLKIKNQVNCHLSILFKRHWVKYQEHPTNKVIASEKWEIGAGDSGRWLYFPINPLEWIASLSSMYV